MSKVDRFKEIKVRNLYYLLAYAFNDEKIQFEDDENFSSEKMKNIYDLFAIVLYIRLKELLQEGSYNEYVGYNEDLPYIKGRVDILNTIRTSSLKTKNRVICNFEDYSENNLINKIIKTTIRYLLNCDIINRNRMRLRQLYYSFENVDCINNPKQIIWDNITFNKLNDKYEVIIKICKYILNDLIMDKENEKETFSKIDDNQKYHTLFEKFIRNYLRIYFTKYRQAPVKSLNIRSETMKWDIDKDEYRINEEYIPTMHTDITISKNNKVKIIDAKFYSQILNNKGFNGSETVSINRDNWYQLFSYIMNKKWAIEKNNVEPETSGMLLYASTGKEFDNFKVSVKIHNNKMEVNVIDFTQEFGNPETAKIGDKTIAGQMKEIAEKIYEELK